MTLIFRTRVRSGGQFATFEQIDRAHLASIEHDAQIRRMRSTVLVIEDCDDFRESVVEILNATGYHGLPARDGFHALDVVRSGLPISLILMDLMMPGMDGFEFCRHRTEDALIASIPLVVVSAYGDVYPIPRDFDVSAVLVKPVQLETLLGTVAAHLREAPALQS